MEGRRRWRRLRRLGRRRGDRGRGDRAGGAAPAAPTVASQIYIHLPVRDVLRAQEFFLALGFEFSAGLGNDRLAMLALGRDKCAMLIEDEYFLGFIPGRQVADTTRDAEALIALTVASRADVDGLIEQAVAAGGQEYGIKVDLEGMYGRFFLDPDGHTWEVMHMDFGPAPAGANEASEDS